MIKNKKTFHSKNCYTPLLFFYFKTAPSLEEQTNFAYLANQPYFMFGSFGIYSFLLFSNSSSLISAFIFLLGISKLKISPYFKRAISPPVAASGQTWPIEAPLDAPLKRPSVIKATSLSNFIPASADVGLSISLIPGPPFGPS